MPANPGTSLTAGQGDGLAKVLDRLRAASEAASPGTAYTCGPPWFRDGSGVLVGSPDPHAGAMIADTDTTLLGGDEDGDGLDGEAEADFLVEARNFARLILSRPNLLAALRTAAPAPGDGRDAAEAFARRAHAGHVDKAGAPYTGHLGRVAARARAYAEAWGLSTTQIARCAAAGWLHDVIEGTDAGAETLGRAGFSHHVIFAVCAVTRHKRAGETYADWISSLALRGHGDPVVLAVKLADLDDNLDPARGASLPDSLRRRYEAARVVLLAALPDRNPRHPGGNAGGGR